MYLSATKWEKNYTTVLFITFWRPSILLSLVATPIYIPTNTVLKFHFLHVNSPHVKKQPRRPLTDEWIKKVGGIYTVGYQSQNGTIWVSCSEMDEPRACYTEWSKSEREKQISYINAYIWNLKNGTNEPICREGMEMQM